MWARLNSKATQSGLRGVISRWGRIADIPFHDRLPFAAIHKLCFVYEFFNDIGAK
jgi:hypothetical protein